MPQHSEADDDRPATASIIIPVFNGIQYTRRCVEALLRSETEERDFEIIAVDNASTDMTSSYLVEVSNRDTHVRVIRNQENMKFARACNQGAAAARGQILVFLNNDTEPLPGWLGAGVARLRSNPDIGIVGSKLLYPDRTVQHCGIEFMKDVQPDYLIWPEHRHRHAPEADPRVNIPEEVQAVTGACLFITAELFRAVGGFSDEYGMYFEDTDLCFAVRRLGKQVFYEPQSVLIHHEGISSPSREGIDELNRSAARIFYKKWRKEIKELEFSFPDKPPRGTCATANDDTRRLQDPKPVDGSFRESDGGDSAGNSTPSGLACATAHHAGRPAVSSAAPDFKYPAAEWRSAGEWSRMLADKGDRGKVLLLGIAPWPTLLSIVRSHPRLWVIWGSLSPIVAQRFESLGIEVCADPLPMPFHKGKVPRWVRRSWRGIVVPALGRPLPSRWPVLRRLAHLSSPLFVASHGSIANAPHPIPSVDAFTWALDRLEYPPATSSGSGDTILTCVRADLLGDVLLSVPALACLGAMQPLRLIVRQEWLEWVRLLLPPETRVRGVFIEPWAEPAFESTTTALDLSPPGWRSPLTPAIARSIPAKIHRTLTKRHAQDGLSAMIASEFDVEVSWPEPSVRSSDIGVIIPGGSSDERLLPLLYWNDAARRISEAMGIGRWVVLDSGGRQAAAIAAALPNASAYPFPQPPQRILSLCKQASVMLGVSTAITHLGSLTGTPTLVVEHPSTVPWLYRSPVPFVRYIRPERPWWRDDPTESDLDRALDEPSESYGFLPDEWCSQLNKALASPPFADA